MKQLLSHIFLIHFVTITTSVTLPSGVRAEERPIGQSSNAIQDAEIDVADTRGGTNVGLPVVECLAAIAGGGVCALVGCSAAMACLPCFGGIGLMFSILALPGIGALGTGGAVLFIQYVLGNSVDRWPVAVGAAVGSAVGLLVAMGIYTVAVTIGWSGRGELSEPDTTIVMLGHQPMLLAGGASALGGLIGVLATTLGSYLGSGEE